MRNSVSIVTFLCGVYISKDKTNYWNACMFPWKYCCLGAMWPSTHFCTVLLICIYRQWKKSCRSMELSYLCLSHLWTLIICNQRIGHTLGIIERIKSSGEFFVRTLFMCFIRICVGCWFDWYVLASRFYFKMAIWECLSLVILFFFQSSLCPVSIQFIIIDWLPGDANLIATNHCVGFLEMQPHCVAVVHREI